MTLGHKDGGHVADMICTVFRPDNLSLSNSGAEHGLPLATAFIQIPKTIAVARFEHYLVCDDCAFFALYRVTAEPSDSSTATASSV